MQLTEASRLAKYKSTLHSVFWSKSLAKKDYDERDRRRGYITDTFINSTSMGGVDCYS